MSEPASDTKPKISLPPPPSFASGCVDVIVQLIIQGMVGLGAFVGASVKGPAGLLLGVGVFVLGLVLVTLMLRLRDQAP